MTDASARIAGLRWLARHLAEAGDEYQYAGRNDLAVPLWDVADRLYADAANLEENDARPR